MSEKEKKKMSLMIDLEGLDLPPGEKERGSQELVTVVVHNIMYSYAKNGIREDERKQYYRVVDAFETAKKDKLEVVELTEQDWGFLRKCKREASMVPNRLLERVENQIDSLASR